MNAPKLEYLDVFGNTSDVAGIRLDGVPLTPEESEGAAAWILARRGGVRLATSHDRKYVLVDDAGGKLTEWQDTPTEALNAAQAEGER